MGCGLSKRGKVIEATYDCHIPHILQLVAGVDGLVHRVHDTLEALATAKQNFHIVTATTQCRESAVILGVLVLIVSVLRSTNGDSEQAKLVVSEAEPFVSVTRTSLDETQALDAFELLLQTWNAAKLALPELRSAYKAQESLEFLHQGKEFIESSQAGPGEAAATMRFLKKHHGQLLDAGTALHLMETQVDTLNREFPKSAQLYSSQQSELIALATAENPEDLVSRLQALSGT